MAYKRYSIYAVVCKKCHVFIHFYVKILDQYTEVKGNQLFQPLQWSMSSKWSAMCVSVCPNNNFQTKWQHNTILWQTQIGNIALAQHRTSNKANIDSTLCLWCHMYSSWPNAVDVWCPTGTTTWTSSKHNVVVDSGTLAPWKHVIHKNEVHNESQCWWGELN